MTSSDQPCRGTEIVLLVDDNPSNLQILYQTLDRPEYRLLVANEGAQALNIAARIRPALVLLDIMMPDMDGYEVCRRLKADPLTGNTSVIFLSALTDTEAKVRGFELGGVDFISKPFQADEILARVDTHLKIHRLERDLSHRNRELKELNSDLEAKVRERSAQLLRGRDAVIFGLAKLAETRDNETGQHLERMCRYAAMLARELAGVFPEIDASWIETIRATAALHDIGKIGIPDAILHKPGKLDAGERLVMNRHPGIGGKTLIEIQDQWGQDSFLEMASQIAMSHHERWDGSGYPDGLKRDEIPLAARIVSLADVYDALTSNRPYKTSWGHAEARNFIQEGAGRQFDPSVVQSFNAIEKRFETVAAQFRNRTGDPA